MLFWLDCESHEMFIATCKTTRKLCFPNKTIPSKWFHPIKAMFRIAATAAIVLFASFVTAQSDHLRTFNIDARRREIVTQSRGVMGMAVVALEILVFLLMICWFGATNSAAQFLNLPPR